jgi:arylsulfatase A-like enzyme
MTAGRRPRLPPGLCSALAFALSACAGVPPAEAPLELLSLPAVVPRGASSPIEVRDERLGGELRAALGAPAGSEVRFRVRLPPRPFITFAIGLEAQATAGPGRVRFTVRVGADRPSFQAYRRDLPRARAGVWIDQSVDLRLFAGQEVWVSLATSPLVPEPPAHGAAPLPQTFFAEPTLHDRARLGAGRGLVLISVDTLRRDHLSLYGYRRPTTPCLDELAREAVTFDDAVSTSSWTLPAHASLFTALYPTAHGAVDLHRGLSQELDSLPAILRDAGFFTGAVVTHLYLSAAYGMDRGFRRHIYLAEARATEVTDRAIAFLRSRGDRDYVLFLHYYDPHWHYDPPAPFDRSFDPNYRGPATGVWWKFKEESRDTIAPSDLSHIIALYDGEIRYTDREIGRLIREMKKLGLFRPAMVLVTSDHGEEFLDHGGWEHQKTLYEEQLRIPLLVKLPGNEAAGERISRQVSLVDVAPTVLDVYGLPVPASVQGRSLYPLIRSPARADWGPVAAWAETEHTLDQSHKVSLRQGEGGKKWIWSRHPSRPATAVEVYDLARDGAEGAALDNGSATERERARQRMREFLAASASLRDSRPATPRVELAPGEIERLRALGYVR